MNYDSIGKDVLEIVTDNVFMRMADTQTPQGIMAVVRMSDTDWKVYFRQAQPITSYYSKIFQDPVILELL